MKRLLASFCIIAAINLILVCCRVDEVNAQELAGRVAGLNPADTQVSTLVKNTDSLVSVTDTIKGRNSKGPYTLSWRPIANDSEQIVVDMHIMQKGDDYNIDYLSSMIAFKSPVGAASTIKVQYRYDPALAVQNKSSLNLPLSLDLLKKDNVGLQFIGLYKQADSSKTSSDLAVIGLTGNTKAKSAEMNSMFLYNPGLPGNQVPDDSSFLDRSAMKFGGTAKTDNFQLTTSYLHVGELFGASKEYQLQQGTDVMDIAASFAASKSLNLASAFKQSESLTGANKGEKVSTTSHNIAFTPDGAPKLSVSRVEVDKEKPGTVDQKTISDTIKLEHKVGTKISAVASHESTTVESGNTEDKTTLDQVNISTKPNDRLGINASLVRKDTTKDGETKTMGFNVDALASKTLSIKAAVNRLDSEKTGADNTESIYMALAPNQKTNIGMNLAHRNTDAAGETNSMGLNIAVIPTKTLNIKAAVNRMDTDAAGADNSETVNMALTPNQKTNIGVNLAHRSTDAAGESQSMGFNIAMIPNKTVNLKAAMNRSDTDATGADNSESLNLLLNPNSKISAEVNMAHRETDAVGNEMTQSMKVVSAPRTDVQLELGLTEKNVDKPEDESTRVAKLSTTAIKNTKIQVDWAGKDSEVKGKEEVGTVRLESTPNKSVKITGSLGKQETATSTNLNREARLVVVPSTKASVGGAFSEVENNGNIIARVKEVNAAAKPISFLELSGAYKTREYEGQSELNSLNLALSLDAGSLIKLTGSYIMNPEDAKGVIQRTNSQTVALNSNLGRLKLKGAYTMNEEYLASKKSDKAEYGIDMQFSTATTLTTSYSLDRKKDISQIETSVYALGFTHNVGSRFNFYLGGKLTAYERDQVYMRDLTDYQAEAKLGLKF
ncbi:MAG: hypothetical protein ACYC27_01445 [Armatimonadota bacterium]